MAFARPQYSKAEVQRAGEWLRQPTMIVKGATQHLSVIGNWRAAHAYPLNTFQSTLRKKLLALGLDSQKAPVGQRLKRLPSIAKKLRRFPNMNLQQMQDIAGLRAVVPTSKHLLSLHNSYERSGRFPHELRAVDNYVAKPKPDGYRSVHLIYRYENPRASEFEGLHVELQIRTRLQHSWATAVETVDAFANQAIKGGEESLQWGEFFRLASAAFALSEGAAVTPGYERFTMKQLTSGMNREIEKHNLLMRLRGFSVAANHIHQDGVRLNAAYHLVALNLETRRVVIKQFSSLQLEQAMQAYGEEERKTAAGQPIDAVLIAGGGVKQLRKTYPNYFLDASEFLGRVSRLTERPSGL